MKYLLLSLVFFLVSSLVPFSAFAQHMDMHHKETTDGVFVGTLQSNPEETPTAQQSNTLTFTVQDTTHKFQIDNCDCEVTIAMPGKLPYTQKIATPAAATGGLYSVMVPFVFPRGGTYKITFTGSPTTPHAFQPFKLTWDLEVHAAKNEMQVLKTSKNAHWPIMATAAALIALAIGGFFIFKIK